MKDLCGDGRTAVKVSSERFRFESHGDTRRLFDESRSTKSALAPVRMGGRDGPPRRRAVHDYRHRDYHLRGVRIHHGDDRGGPRRRWRLGIFSTMMGAVILFVIGGVLAGVGGWLMRLWWIFLLVGAVTGSVGNT